MLAKRALERERGLDLPLPSPMVLAVSGGADSMVMADAVLKTSPDCVVAMATFDHGTGASARAAVELVADWGRARGIPVHIGRATSLVATEAAWRAARWEFLRGVGLSLGSPIATAHSRDDQAETVFIRLLRGSGVRGLAGLLAPGPVQRPLLLCDRSAIRHYALTESVPYVDDPSNGDLRHLRNRVRLEILPALERGSPGFRDWLLTLGQRAAEWRRDVAETVDRSWAPSVRENDGAILVPRDAKHLPSVDEAALFWPDVAGRVGVALDRRGTARLASFTTTGATGQRIPLSGGVVVSVERSNWTLQRSEARSGEAHRPFGWHHTGTD